MLTLFLSLAIACFSLPTAMAGVQSAPVDTEQTPFFRQREAVITAVRAKDWVTAEVAARQFFDFTIPRGNPYEQLDAADLLIVALHQQGRYADALGVVDRMIAVTRDTAGGPVPGQIDSLLQRGMIEAVLAEDAAALRRYQRLLHSGAKSFPGLWHWDMDKQQIRYVPAKMTFPLAQGRWILTKIQQAGARSRPARLDYQYVTRRGTEIDVDIGLSYLERSQEEKQAWLQRAHSHLLSGQQLLPDAKFVQQLPDLSYADALQTRYAVQETSSDHDLWTLHWEVMRGNWYLSIKAAFQARDAADAQEQVPALVLHAIEWPEAIDLPGDGAIEAHHDDIARMGLYRQDWQQAGALAQAELPNAIWPREIALLQSVSGIAAYQAGEMSRANQALNVAMSAWPYVSQSGYDSTLYEYALEYAAEIAAKAGDDDAAMRLTRQYVGSVGTYFEWDLQAEALVHRQSRQVLPLRAAGFHIHPLDDKRFHYQDTDTNQTLGLTVGLPVLPNEDEQERRLIQALDQQFQLDVQVSHRTAYKPASQVGEPSSAQGTRWIFDVTPQAPESGMDEASTTTDDPVVDRVIFWAMDHGTTRTILRASVNSDEQEKRAAALADALPW